MYPLLLNKDKYEVGRDTACDICLADVSVSRKHAVLYPVQDSVKLEDERSSCGTFINGNHLKTQRVPKDAHSFLKHNDVVYFGGKGNKWRLKRIDISVATTKLDARDSVELKTLLRVLNGNLVQSEWSNSITHLVTTKITFTPKLLLALVNSVPVVNLQFFRDAAERIVMDTNKLPDVKNYIPPATDDCSGEYDFGVNELRKSLFEGLGFIFLEENKMKVFEKIIKSAGGMVSLWDKKKASIIRVASRVIGNTNGSEAEHQEVADYLLKKGRRLISDSEIGIAIAAVSTEKYCNPKYHPDLGHILALETPYLQVCNSSDIMLMEEVPETIYIADDDEEEDDVSDRKALRKGTSNNPPRSNTEVPETGAVVENVPNDMFPDDDEDEFNARSQQILQIVDRHSLAYSPADPQRKRKHSECDESIKESPPIKRMNSKTNISAAATRDCSQFISRPSQKQTTQVSAGVPAPPPKPTAVVTNKPKRTLADLLAKDDDDSEDEMLNYKKKSRPLAMGPKKNLPSLLKAVETVKVAEVEPVKPCPEPSRIRISQVTDWLSKTMTNSCKITAESLDETRAWIAPLLNSIQVKEIKVDLSNTTRSRSIPSISNISDNLSNWTNFKTFKKQSFHKTCSLDPEVAKTKSILITEKL